ncbi:hypothetical protein Forpe1208_v013206 [Fusarium oxysporum f. sp. rapae]|uniref:Uncharacterized protein n=1 Tax=Fusarium oxysporum f. sp. rapae TaxID=485398 RepID=A0A8J5NMU4_FUSOX|nr:hypothetical protein Forpe1208_v013206 [Fusarium oxysporum f. sp. rapae]
MNIEVQRTRVQSQLQLQSHYTGHRFLVPGPLLDRDSFFPSPNNACPTSRKAKTKTQLIFTFVSISE